MHSVKYDCAFACDWKPTYWTSGWSLLSGSNRGTPGGLCMPFKSPSSPAAVVQNKPRHTAVQALSASDIAYLRTQRCLGEIPSDTRYTEQQLIRVLGCVCVWPRACFGIRVHFSYSTTVNAGKYDALESETWMSKPTCSRKNVSVQVKSDCAFRRTLARKYSGEKMKY